MTLKVLRVVPDSLVRILVTKFSLSQPVATNTTTTIRSLHRSLLTKTTILMYTVTKPTFQLRNASSSSFPMNNNNNNPNDNNRSEGASHRPNLIEKRKELVILTRVLLDYLQRHEPSLRNTVKEVRAHPTGSISLFYWTFPWKLTGVVASIACQQRLYQSASDGIEKEIRSTLACSRFCDNDCNKP